MPETNKPGESTRIPPPESVRAPKTDPSKLAKLLDGWMEGDETEQRETFEVLRRAMDEGRPDGYKLFP